MVEEEVSKLLHEESGWAGKHSTVCLLCYVVKDTHRILKAKFIGHV